MKCSATVIALTTTLAFACGCQSKAPPTSESTASSATPERAPEGFGKRGNVSSGDLVGSAAPDVSLALHDGSGTTLSALKGSHVVLYFYPKDDTPGCRIEAQGFREHHDALTSAGIKVFGVSMQGAESHRAFIEKERLPFPLVVDDGSIAKAFRVPVISEFAARQTILIAPDGTVKKIWRDVSPDGHAQEVLAAVKG